MTTGDPLVVRAAMKPLPTLTKPLRSVDIATKEPAAGAARAHRLLHGARPRAWWARRWSRWCWRAAYREKLGGDHIDDAKAALRAYEERIGWSRSVATGGAIVLVGFMGAGKSTGARSLAAELGAQALDSDRELEQRIGEPIESFFDREGEAAFRAREEEVVCELLGARRRAGDRARRRRGPVGAGARGARPPHGRAPRDRPRGRLAARVRARAGRWRATRAASRRSGATGARSTSRWPTRDRAAGRPRRAAPRAAVRARAGRGAARDAAGLGRGGVGRLPGLPRARADRGRASSRRWRGRRFVVTDENVARLQRVEGDERIVVDGRRGAQDDPRRRARAALARAGRRGARRPGRGGRRRRGGRPGRLLRGRLPARDAPRAGADDAGGAGRLGLRRQDRRRPARGQELRRRLPPALGGAVRPGRARHAARRGGRRPATRRSSRRR